jgi:hypothetical protein
MSNIKIFSIHAKRTDFLRMQIESLNHFCEDDYEYYCIDNFLSNEQSEFIKKECEELNINYVRFSNYQITGTAFDHIPALNSIKNIASNEDINVILEFDVFLINKFSFINYIEDYHISGLHQQRNNFNNEYLAPFLIIVNKNCDFSEIDFYGSPGFDTGGNTQFYIKDRKVKLLRHTVPLREEGDEDCFTLPYDCSYGSQIIEESFIHYYRGSNWDGKPLDYEKSKTEWLINLLNKSKTSQVINGEFLKKKSSIICEQDLADTIKNHGISDNILKYLNN